VGAVFVAWLWADVDMAGERQSFPLVSTKLEVTRHSYAAAL